MYLSYHLKRQKERIGSIEIEVECLDNLDRTIDHMFNVLAKTNDEAMLEKLCPYFGVVWPAARALAQVIEQTPRPQFLGKKLIEIGCGLAVPSLVASRCGLNITASDYHPEVPAFIRQNIAINNLSQIPYLEIDWQKISEEKNEAELKRLPKFDFVIGSDILYEPRHAEWIARSVDALLSPGGTAIIADPARPYFQNFVDWMKKLGYQTRTEVILAFDTPVSKEVFVNFFSRTQVKN